jgi:hypothetical protein
MRLKRRPYSCPDLQESGTTAGVSRHIGRLASILASVIGDF